MGEVLLTISPYHYSLAIEPKLKRLKEILIIAGRSYFAERIILSAKLAYHTIYLIFIM